MNSALQARLRKRSEEYKEEQQGCLRVVTHGQCFRRSERSLSEPLSHGYYPKESHYAKDRKLMTSSGQDKEGDNQKEITEEV